MKADSQPTRFPSFAHFVQNAQHAKSGSSYELFRYIFHRKNTTKRYVTFFPSFFHAGLINQLMRTQNVHNPVLTTSRLIIRGKNEKKRCSGKRKCVKTKTRNRKSEMWPRYHHAILACFVSLLMNAGEEINKPIWVTLRVHFYG